MIIHLWYSLVHWAVAAPWCHCPWGWWHCSHAHRPHGVGGNLIYSSQTPRAWATADTSRTCLWVRWCAWPWGTRPPRRRRACAGRWGWAPPLTVKDLCAIAHISGVTYYKLLFGKTLWQVYTYAYWAVWNSTRQPSGHVSSDCTISMHSSVRRSRLPSLLMTRKGIFACF